MSIVYSIENTAEERIHSIEKEREKTMADEKFQEWCRRYSIGSRVERVTEERVRANDLMSQYGERYSKYLKRN